MDLDIKEIISREGFQISRSGFISCPFHSEKTASCKIYENSFYCFGCHEGGDAIAFIMKLKDINFKQALIYLGLKPGRVDIRKTPEQLRREFFNAKINQYIRALNMLIVDLKYINSSFFFYNLSVLEYWLDLLKHGTIEEKALLFKEFKKNGF